VTSVLLLLIVGILAYVGRSRARARMRSSESVSEESLTNHGIIC
jgi:hypothetical protein